MTPRRRRLRGDRQLRQFDVTASGGEGAPPLSAVGEFDDRPEGLLPYAAPPVLAVAVVGVLFAFMTFTGGGGGSDPGSEPAAGAGTAAPAAAEAPSCPAIDPLCAGGRIAFGSERDGNLEIYVMNADGRGMLRLTDSPGKDGDPAWTADGTRIAFESDRDGTLEIYSMMVDGSDLTRLTFSNPDEGFINVEPVWSPDGSRIAFASNRAGNAHIYVMNADGSGVQRLSDVPGQGPEWSPDGARVAFTSIDEAGNFDVYTVDADGSNLTRLTRTPAVDAEPSFSPDGTRIAFRSERDGNPEIYVMNADGSSPVRLTNNLAEDGEPAWSPDGTRITFRSFRDATDDIYVMFEDGSSQVRLTSDRAADFTPGRGDRCQRGGGLLQVRRRERRHLRALREPGDASGCPRLRVEDRRTRDQAPGGSRRRAGVGRVRVDGAILRARVHLGRELFRGHRHVRVRHRLGALAALPAQDSSGPRVSAITAAPAARYGP